MSELVRDHAIVHGTPNQVWAIIEDPLALGRVLPGAQSIEEVEPGRFIGVLASRIQFLTVRADVEASYHDADPPRHLRLQLNGRPRGLAGSFAVSVPFDLAPESAPDGSTVTGITYSIDLRVTGRLASFGMPILRDTLRRQVDALVQNVDRELRDATPPESGA